MPAETDLGINEGFGDKSTCSYTNGSPNVDFNSEENITEETVKLSQDLLYYLIFPGFLCNSAGTTWLVPAKGP